MPIENKSTNTPAPTDAPVVTQAATQAPTQTPESTQTPEPTQPAVTDAPVVQTPAPTDTPTPTLAPTVAPTPAPTAPVVLNEQQATVTTLDSTVEAIKRSDNTPAKFVIAGLETYITNMQPGMPVSRDHAVMHQVGLWNTLHNFVENTEQDFNKIFSTVLGLFHKHKDGVFHEHYVFRVMSDITLDKEEMAAFQVFINLLKVTANPVGRQQALKQNVDISRTLANVFSENARQKILGFYGM